MVLHGNTKNPNPDVTLRKSYLAGFIKLSPRSEQVVAGGVG